MATYWQGKVSSMCQLEGCDIQDTFVDGVIRSGQWAIMCPECHKIFGMGLGTGRGQKYKKVSTPNGIKFEKIEG